MPGNYGKANTSKAKGTVNSNAFDEKKTTEASNESGSQVFYHQGRPITPSGQDLPVTEHWDPRTKTIKPGPPPDWSNMK